MTTHRSPARLLREHVYGFAILFATLVLNACSTSEPSEQLPSESSETAMHGLSSPEDSAAESFEQGVRHLRLLNAVKARAAFTAALELEPDHAPTRALLADALGRLGYDDLAAEAAEVAWNGAQALSDTDRLLVEGHYYQNQRDWEKASESYGRLTEAYPQSVDYGFWLCWAQFENRDIEAALETVVRLRRLPKIAAEDARIDLCQVRALQRAGQLRESLEIASIAADKGRQIGADLITAEARLLQIVAHRNLGELTQQAVMQAAREARELFEQNGHPLGTALALELTAGVYFYRGDLNAAQRHWQDALDVNRRIDRPAPSVLLGLGAVARDRGHAEQTRKYYEASLELSRRTNSSRGISQAMGNLGSLAQEEGNLKLALQYQAQALNVLEEAGEVHSAGTIKGNMGEIHAFQGNLEKALELYAQVLGHFRNAEDAPLIAFHRHQTGRALKARGDLFFARRELHGALDSQQTSDALTELAETRLSLAELALAAGNAELAEKLALYAEEVLLIEGLDDLAGWAETLLADALLAQGRIRAAQAISAQALRTAAGSENFRLRFASVIVDAEIRADMGEAAAVQDLESVAAEAEELGLLGWVFKAQLVAGELEAQSGAVGAARDRLTRLAQESRRQGFDHIYRSARATLATLG